MEVKSKSSTIATGFAMFSMFFGAGNIVFPLVVGRYCQHLNIYGVIGLLLTAVVVPFIGLISMTLFNGNYKHFFERVGKVPGFLVALAIMALMGPFGALPRLISLSHSTLAIYSDAISLPLFALVSCVVIFLLTFKKNKIVDILGYYLTPFLLVSLAVIIIKGIMDSPSLPTSDLSPFQAFSKGFLSGYETMDLLGAFFFSSIVISCLESGEIEKGHTKDFRNVIFLTLKASVIGAGLLALTYIGFSFVAACQSQGLEQLLPDQLLGAIAIQVLGPYAGIVAILAVSLACLTTAIALAAVFAEFLHNDIFFGKVGYIPSLIATLIVTAIFSMMSFSGIMAIVAPILAIIYPALIVLSLINIAHKLYHLQSVKVPVALTLILTISAYFW